MSTNILFSHAKRSFGAVNRRNVVIVGGRRTPIGSFMGALSNMTAPQLGAIATKGVLTAYHVDPKEVDEVFFGNVIPAGSG